MIEAQLFMLPLSSAELHVLLGLLVKGTLLCWFGVLIGSELSAMPAVVRHRVALATICCLALLPLLAGIMTPWDLPILSRESPPAGAEFTDALPTLIMVYLVVAGILLARLFADLLRIAILSHRARLIASADEFLPDLHHAKGATPVKYSAETPSPLTWGWLYPVVILPVDARHWKTDELRMVLHHELAHVQRADWVGHLLGRLVRALFWPVPGIKTLLDQLSLSAEQACDDRVLAAGISAPQYAAMLLKHAQGNRIPASVSLGHGTELGTRIRNLVAEIVDHSAFATGSVIPFVLFFLLTLPIASAQLSPRPEIPVMDWGSVAPTENLRAPTYPTHRLRVDPLVLTALESGPARPAPPPAPQRPPGLDSLEKPTVPPPGNIAPKP